MKKFNFKFEKLLEYRSHLEQEELNEFSKVLGEYVKIENIINDSIAERSRILTESKRLQESGDLSYFFLRDKARKALKTRMGINQKLLEEKAIPLEKQRKKLIEAQKNKKVIEKLKEKALEKYKEENIKEEQDEFDEFGMTSYHRKNIDF